MRFTDSEDDEPENGKEVQGVASHPIEGHQGPELSNGNIDRCDGCIEEHGIDRRVPKPRSIPE